MTLTAAEYLYRYDNMALLVIIARALCSAQPKSTQSQCRTHVAHKSFQSCQNVRDTANLCVI